MATRPVQGGVMGVNTEEFWSSVPEKALHPVREPILEAMWRVNKPVSAIDLVDVSDGLLTMWEALHHLQALEEIGVVEPTSARAPGQGAFHRTYRLTSH